CTVWPAIMTERSVTGLPGYRVTGAVRRSGPPAAWPGPGSGVRPGAQPERAPLEGPALVLAQAAPHARVLPGFNGPVQARFHNRTTMTNVLGFVDLEKCWTGVSDREEQLRIHVTA